MFLYAETGNALSKQAEIFVYFKKYLNRRVTHKNYAGLCVQLFETLRLIIWPEVSVHKKIRVSENRGS